MRLFNLSSRLNKVRIGIDQTFTFPERFRGTIVEKWANYWKGLFNDYTEVAVGIFREAKDNPKKSLLYALTSYGLYACAKKNPDEEDFLKQFRTSYNEMILVSSELQNPTSEDYIRRLQVDLNQNRLRFLSLWLFTIMWEDLYDKDDCTYPAICEYTKVTYWSFHEQIIDIGFWNKFWRLNWKLINYDVNYL
uniref:Mitochondrial import inner membrane translocase subunit Tim29 n=1 Tax=Glossina morsitans morsitans TaxID=37546 RepID=A0A1B0FAG4_GLOMM